ncbi:DUF305 domain-containing protein [Promicromonospora soli]
MCQRDRSCGNAENQAAEDQRPGPVENAEGAEAGRLFLEQMIVHHQGAIEMAQTEVEDGANEAAIKMADTIASSQSSEVQTMQDLLAGM